MGRGLGARLLFVVVFVVNSPIKSVVLFVLYIFLVVDENMGAHIAVVVFFLVLLFSTV